MKQLILVDACNVLHATDSFRDRLGEGMDLLAGELLEILRPLHDADHWELHLVIDGKGGRLEQQFPDKSRTLSLVFSPAGRPADVVIESWLMRLGPDWKVRVATNDRAIVHTALAQGAEPIRPAELLDWAAQVRQRIARRHSNQAKLSSGDFGNKLEGLL